MIGFSGPIILSAPAGCQARPKKAGFVMSGFWVSRFLHESPRIHRRC